MTDAETRRNVRTSERSRTATFQENNDYSKGTPPPQTGESAVVGVSRDPLAP